MKFRTVQSASLPALLLLIAVSDAVAHARDDGFETRGGDEDTASLQRDEGTIHHGGMDQWPIRQNAIGVRKMTDDEGEKFLSEYWTFDDAEVSITGNTSVLVPRDINDADSPGTAQLRPALSRHTNEYADSFQLTERYSGRARRALSILLGRGFECPTGTLSCTSINEPQSCCNIGDTCQLVQDTGLGNVGCCPPGESCSGGLSSCAPNYTSCPSNLGGGCCIPGYECVTGGCAFVSTFTVTQHSTTTVVSSTVTTSALSTTSTSTTSTSVSTSALTTSSSVTLIPPVRPTTHSQTTSTSASPTTIPSNASTCPTGFYACSAVYQGGCCRIGRDCDTTSCPTTAATTIITSNGVTIVVPTGGAATVASGGSCATGWFSCAASDGGGCCPSGFACGSSCIASASGTPTATIAKEQPGAAGRTWPALYLASFWTFAALYFVMRF